MIAEWGLLSLVLALIFAALATVIPTIGLIKEQAKRVATIKTYVLGQVFFITLAFGCLSLCFLQNDFSLIYVVNNSSLALPWFYKLCAVWGGHEGSMLLWVVILSFWILLIRFFSASLGAFMQARVLIVLSALSFGFILFLLTTSNPFLRQFVVLDTPGRDLNPLLQDPGFLFHPPMLYMGYVGFAVAFAFAIAALWEGKMETSWAKWTRPWTLAAWSCLTLGITLGSWWAYRELGWGGWWFWDPVENASFMPWLAGTALFHSLAVTEQRQHFKAWTLLLAITAFSLSLVGTFLVRSGVLTSVHAFAVDPKRGLYILSFLTVVIGGALGLFALRSQTLQSQKKLELVSKESALLLNNVLLVVILSTVLMGTLYPLIIDGLGLGKLSVGAPYFNAVFVPLMIPLLILMGLGIHLQWQQDKILGLLKRLNAVVLCSIFIPFLILWNSTAEIQFGVYLGLILAFWILLSTALMLVKRLQQRGFKQLGLAYLGMLSAHCGLAITVIGITVSTGYGIEDELLMRPGKAINFAGHRIEFKQAYTLKGPNYSGMQTEFSVTKNAKTKVIYPEKRIYNLGQMAMTESAIDVSPFRDIYIALGEPLDGEAWSVRIYYKPFVRWIWAGGFLLFMGGGLALIDRRYYKKRSEVTAQLVEDLA